MAKMFQMTLTRGSYGTAPTKIGWFIRVLRSLRADHRLRLALVVRREQIVIGHGCAVEAHCPAGSSTTAAKVASPWP
jgi:hypothetical protein